MYWSRQTHCQLHMSGSRQPLSTSDSTIHQVNSFLFMGKSTRAMSTSYEGKEQFKWIEASKGNVDFKWTEVSARRWLQKLFIWTVKLVCRLHCSSSRFAGSLIFLFFFAFVVCRCWGHGYKGLDKAKQLERMRRHQRCQKLGGCRIHQF